ncbi:serine--tRNA ligase [Wolbachia pipientis]|uniref:Serine--tRNA ligase n=1 Tax=Wolbachia pipientis TaxID=955 RepID=A0A1E7QLJ2_WOLPI|nr:serine--tRNA ligase [Wolbachia pipientis]OEY87084.1 serine--tRNA ligase [Wolbachia pipientis]
MHDIEYIRQNPNLFDKAMKSRGLTQPVSAEILKLDQEDRALITKAQGLHKQRNELTTQIRELKASQNTCESEIMLSQNITSEIEMVHLKEKVVKEKLLNLLSNLPNVPEENLPIGESSVEVKESGEKKQFTFVPKLHYELGERLGLMNFTQAAQISGSRFVMLQGELAKLGRALINFMLDMHTNEFSYTEVYHPALVKDKAMYNVGQLPKFSDDSYLTSNGLRLIPTSEVALTNLVADKFVNEEVLPTRFTAYSECFRKEAGSAGRDTKGMMRQHQFGKVELVSITDEDQSSIELERMVNIAEEVLRRLELPYRVVLLGCGDMSFAAQKTYDIEVWLPGQSQYREISSCSNCGAFQARRMNAKVSRTKKYLHTLNGSALAIGRTIIAIMENYQNSDGSITMPNVLQKYIGCHTIFSLR